MPFSIRRAQSLPNLKAKPPKPVVILGGPGTGKSTWVKENTKAGRNQVKDTDSSYFSWLRDKKGNQIIGEDGKPKRNPNATTEYVDHLEKLAARDQVVLGSTQPGVPEALAERGIEVKSVFAKPEDAQEFLNTRILPRPPASNISKEGHANFLNIMTSNFGKFSEGFRKRPAAKTETKIEIGAQESIAPIINAEMRRRGFQYPKNNI